MSSSQGGEGTSQFSSLSHKGTKSIPEGSTVMLQSPPRGPTTTYYPIRIRASTYEFSWRVGTNIQSRTSHLPLLSEAGLAPADFRLRVPAGYEEVNDMGLFRLTHRGHGWPIYTTLTQLITQPLCASFSSVVKWGREWLVLRHVYKSVCIRR